YDAALAAFRAGATDVIVKAPDQVEYLKRRVVELCRDGRQGASTTRILDEVVALHEDFLRRLMETARRTAELEARLGGGEPQPASDAEGALLVVEPATDGWLSGQLLAELGRKGGYRLRTAGSGGEGLDAATAQRFHIALVRDQLPDLPGTMVVSTLRAQSPE